MKKILLIMTLLMSQVYSVQYCHEDSGWCFDQTPLQSFLLFHIDAISLDYALGSGSLDTGDLLGAFNAIDPDGIPNNGDEYDACIGFLVIGDVDQPDGSGVVTLMLMGDDGGYPDYLNPGDVPDLKVYDSSQNIEICATTSMNILGFELNGFQNFHGLWGFPLNTITGNDQDCDTCIFDEDNNDDSYVDDPCLCQGDTEYCGCDNNPVDGFCDCDGSVDDCAGVCGGNAVTDCLGECDGSAVEDCLGECGGISELDCAGDCDGNAYVNECGCVGGNTEIEIDCCHICDDSYATNYDENGSCVDEDIPGYGDDNLCIPFDAQGLVAVETGNGERGKISLTWLEVEGNISHYKILRNDEISNSEIIYTLNSNPYYVDDDLLPSTPYTYSIKAIHAGGEESNSWSDSAIAQTSDLVIPLISQINEGEEELFIYLNNAESEYNGIDYDYRLYRTSNINSDTLEMNFSNLNYTDRNNLVAGSLYCYRASSVYKENNNLYLSGMSDEICGTPLEATGWEVTVEATILGLGVIEETDLINYFGMTDDATDGFDTDAIDFPEPPPSPGNFIQFYFPHPEWQAPYTQFTQDIREERTLSDNLETWSAEVVSSMDGPLELKFIFDQDIEHFGDPRADIIFPIYVLIDDDYKLIEMPRCLGVGNATDNEGHSCISNNTEESCTNDCTWFENSCANISCQDDNCGLNEILVLELKNGEDDLNGYLYDTKLECESQDYNWFGTNIIEYENTAYDIKSLDIIVGSMPPQVPTGVESEAYNYDLNSNPETAWITLSWDETEECCQSIESRYPATHYYIYRTLTADIDDPSTPEIDESQEFSSQLIDNCEYLEGTKGGECDNNSLNSGSPCVDNNDCADSIDENGSIEEGECDAGVLINENNCNSNRYYYTGIVPADQFAYVDSTLDLRAIPFLDKIMTVKTIDDIIIDDIDYNNDNVVDEKDLAQWKVTNARHIFETQFRYKITAVNENFPNSTLSPLSSGIYGTESGYSIEVTAETRLNQAPETKAGNDQIKTVPHDGNHLSMESFEDNGIDAQPDTQDFLDYGLDGILSENEPGYDPVLYPDPNGDDWDPENNPEGTEGNEERDWIDLNGNDYRDPEDIGEPGENDGKFTFYDWGGDRTRSKYEDGYDEVTNPDPHNDDWHPVINPTGTEGNFIHDLQEYSEQYNDDGCIGCADSDSGNGVWNGNFDYITIQLDGSESSDPEYGVGQGALNFVWQQMAGPNIFLNTLEQSNFTDSNGNGQCDESEVEPDEYGNYDDCFYGGQVQPIFNAVVPYGAIYEPQIYEFKLTAQDTYFSGWPPERKSHDFPENVTITVNPESNEAPYAQVDPYIPCPIAPENCGIDVFCSGDWECDYAIYQYDEELPVIFDYSTENQILGHSWRVPHDGDPNTDMAVIGIMGEESMDVLVPMNNSDTLQYEPDEIFYEWFTNNAPEPYNDLGNPPNGQYDDNETFFDLNNNGVWDGGDPYSGKNIIINRSSKEHTIQLNVNDVYGAVDSAFLEIKVLPEENQKPIVEIGADSIKWYLDEFSETHEVKLPYTNLIFYPDPVGDGEWLPDPNGNFKQVNLSYDPDILEVFDCGLDGACDEDEEGFMLYGPDGFPNTGDEVFDPSQDGCTNPDYYAFQYTDCALTGTEGNEYWDGIGEHIDYNKDGQYTEDLGDGLGEKYVRDELTYNWSIAGDDSPSFEGDTITVHLAPGNYTFYLDVCDPYDGFEVLNFDPFQSDPDLAWYPDTYNGCSTDSVVVIILDEEPPGKPNWSAEPLKRSLYYMDLDWNYNIDENCTDTERTDYEEECEPGFVDNYKVYRNGQLISTIDAWEDNNGDETFKLDDIANPDDDYLSNFDTFIDCQYVCDGGQYENMPCSRNMDCEVNSGWDNGTCTKSICSKECNDSEDCSDLVNIRPSWFIANPLWDSNELVGNGWFDPSEPFTDTNNDDIWNDNEFFNDCKLDRSLCCDNENGDYTDDECDNEGWDASMGNGKWDAAEFFRDCNIDITICDGDPDWNSLPEDQKNDEYDFGEPFFDINGNNIWDDEERYLDSNLNDEFDLAESYEDLNDNGQWDSGDIFYKNIWWDPSGDGYSGDYINSYPQYRDSGIDGLESNEQYCYFIVATNSSGISSYPSNSECAYTALLPSIEIITPNGSEIYTKGESFQVEWKVTDGGYVEEDAFGLLDTIYDPNIFYIKDIFVEYTIGQSPYNGNNIIWYTDDYSSISNMDQNDIVNVSIYDINDIEPNNVELRVTITDIGDNSVENYMQYGDVSDNRFTLSTNRLSSLFPQEWSLFGCPLVLADPVNIDIDGNEIGNGMIDNLGTEQNLGDFGTNWYVYNQNSEFPTDEHDEFLFNHGRGYILTLNETSAVTLNGGVINYPKPEDFQSNSTLDLDDGWNLISNMLVSDINKEDLVIHTFGQNYSWIDAVNFGFVQSELHGWDNSNRTYYSVDTIKPWDGYWIHVSRDLDIKFRPSIPDEIVARENRSEIWALNFRARGLTNGASGDYITVGLSDSASAGFRYGEDEYDIPVPLGDKYIDIFFDKSDWVGGQPDINGNSVLETEFYRDIRPYTALDQANYWQISSNTFADDGIDGIEPWNDEDEVEFSWSNFDAIIGLPNHNIFLHVDGNYYDMKIEESVIVENVSEREVVIQIGGSSPLAYDSAGLPTHFSVSAAYPNPFNPISHLNYAIPNSGNVNISIFNINGQLIENLVDDYKPAGYYNVSWNAFNISSGIYFIKIESGQNVSTQKLMLMK